MRFYSNHHSLACWCHELRLLPPKYQPLPLQDAYDPFHIQISNLTPIFGERVCQLLVSFNIKRFVRKPVNLYFSKMLGNPLIRKSLNHVSGFDFGGLELTNGNTVQAWQEITEMKIIKHTFKLIESVILYYFKKLLVEDY